MTRHNREPRLEEVPMIPLEQMTYDERLRFIEMVVWTPVEQRQSVLDRYGVSADCFMHLVQNENLTQLEVNAGRSCRAPIKTRTEEQVRKSLSMIQAALQERAVAATSVPDLVEDADVPADDAETEEIETADDIARELDLIEQQWDEEDRARGKEPAVSAAQAPAPVADSPPIEAAPVTHLFKLAPDEEAEFVFLETKLPTPSAPSCVNWMSKVTSLSPRRVEMILHVQLPDTSMGLTSDWVVMDALTASLGWSCATC